MYPFTVLPTPIRSRQDTKQAIMEKLNVNKSKMEINIMQKLAHIAEQHLRIHNQRSSQQPSFRWALWCLQFDRTKHWDECSKKVILYISILTPKLIKLHKYILSFKLAVFNDFDGFSALYRHRVIPSPSILHHGMDYYLFKV